MTVLCMELEKADSKKITLFMDTTTLHNLGNKFF